MKDGNFRIFHFREFWKNPFFLQKFCEKSSEISSGQNSQFLGFKKPCFGVLKTLFFCQKQGFWGQKQGFPNIRKLRNILNFFYSEFSENYEKMMLKSNFYFCKNLFRLKFLLEYLSSSSVCRP